MSLKVENLSKRYEQTWVLKDVSFEAEAGEVLGIFGLTGAGKSTLLRVLSGAENCDTGKIFHRSNDVTALSCDDRCFHFPRLSNGSFWKNLFKTEKKSPLADGEGQVLALDEALEKADGVLLLDDSFCYMDALLRAENYRKLKDAARAKNLTVLMATNDKSYHSVNEVKTDGARCCVSNYYFSPHSPNGYETSHVTYFQARPEQTVRRLVTKVDSDIRTALRKVVKKGFAKKDLYKGED